MSTPASINKNDVRGMVTGIDSIVIKRVIDTKTGGATLTIDSSEFDEKSISAGHIVIHNPSTNDYKPLGVLNGVLQSKPSGYEYYGIVIATTPADMPMVGVLTNGVVNFKAMKYDISSILPAVKQALTFIQFIED